MSSLIARRGFLIGVCSAMLAPRRAGAREIAGIRLEESLIQRASGAQLRLAGAGIFRFFLLRYYICGLYLAASTPATDALRHDAARRIAMVMLRNVSAGEFLWGLDRGMADNTTAAEMGALRPSLGALRAAIREAGSLARGAHVALDYAPGQGTLLGIDGRVRTSAIPGKPFNDALLRMWLGERPLDSSLKEALLAG
jgi:hypothetical protein